ncbi:hypothetical protein H1P_110001 [Hyella patelloides LEGE 07179]|uniref:Uncharacterized protein n=1 Tax=Hyella patelloides LEGE 07179 TaxID=945734 RepID=A0A563VJH1_9CYAN|nr:hypothetical protein H1P_110001 [Hyella patelloides LEGE 07179]
MGSRKKKTSVLLSHISHLAHYTVQEVRSQKSEVRSVFNGT